MSRTELQEWHHIGGDKIYRYNYELDENSVVFDLGGYEGLFTSNIYKIFRCNTYIFEPSDRFCSRIKTRFTGKDKVRIFNYGLSGKNEMLTLVHANDSSYILESREQKSVGNAYLENVELKSFKEVYQTLDVDIIDLMKINIEGGEYELLEHILDVGLVSKIKNLQIQFHDIFPDSLSIVNSIRERLKETHKQDWKFEWAWENWSLK